MIKFGVSPIAWSNDDLPALGGETSLVSCLTDIQELGFQGVELGGKFPRDHEILQPLLKSHDLELVGGWYSCNLLERDAEEEIKNLQPHLNLLKAMGCSVFILAETSNAIHSDIDRAVSEKPVLSKEDFLLFCDRMNSLARYIEEQGLKMAYHHHLGTVVETGTELIYFLEHTSDSLKITLDTGHAFGGGVEVFDLIKTYGHRISHVHCKDMRSDVFASVVKSDQSFLNGVIDGMFTVPGDGDIDFRKVLANLKSINYSGWIIIEAEQDPKKADPKAFANLGLKSLKRVAEQLELI